MVQLAFPLFRELPVLNAKAMTKSLSKRHRWHKFASEKNDGDICSIEVDSVSVLIKPIAAPIPGDDIAQTHPFARRGWHGTSDTPDDHLAHAVVTSFGTADPKLAAVAMTIVLDEICQSQNCLGVLWGVSGVLAHRSIVTRFASRVDVDEPALNLWVSALPYQAEAGVGLSTRGLSAFIGRDLHFMPSEHHDPETVFERAMDIAEYLYANGPVVLDGQSVGYSEIDVIRAKWTEESSENDSDPQRWIELTVERLDPST